MSASVYSSQGPLGRPSGFVCDDTPSILLLLAFVVLRLSLQKFSPLPLIRSCPSAKAGFLPPLKSSFDLIACGSVLAVRASGALAVLC